jgi:hypothetical protein
MIPAASGNQNQLSVLQALREQLEAAHEQQRIAAMRSGRESLSGRIEPSVTFETSSLRPETDSRTPLASRREQGTEEREPVRPTHRTRRFEPAADAKSSPMAAARHTGLRPQSERRLTGAETQRAEVGEPLSVSALQQQQPERLNIPGPTNSAPLLKADRPQEAIAPWAQERRREDQIVPQPQRPSYLDRLRSEVQPVAPRFAQAWSKAQQQPAGSSRAFETRGALALEQEKLLVLNPDRHGAHARVPLDERITARAESAGVGEISSQRRRETINQEQIVAKVTAELDVKNEFKLELSRNHDETLKELTDKLSRLMIESEARVLALADQRFRQSMSNAAFQRRHAASG